MSLTTHYPVYGPWIRQLLTISAVLLFSAAGVTAQVTTAQDAHSPPSSEILTVDQCIDIALQRNSTVLIARGQVDQAEGTSLGSWSAVMPQISATLYNSSRTVLGQSVYSGTVQQTLPDGSVTFVKQDITRDGQTINSFSAGLSVDQTIYDGGASWNQIKQARQNARAVMLNETAAESQVALTVKQQYYNLLKVIRLYEVQEESVRLSAEQLRQSEAMYRLGSVAKADVLRARADLGGSRITLANQAALIRQAKAGLNTAMGRPMRTPLEIADMAETDTANFPAPLNVDQAIAEALQNNLDIMNSTAQTKIARLGKKIARGGLLPRISGFFNYSRSNSQIDRVYKNFNQNWNMSFGINVRLNILNGTQTYGDISRASAAFYIAEERLEQQKRQTILAIEQAAADLDAARQVIDLSRESIEAAEESLRLEQARYRVGTGRQLDVIDAQFRFIQARYNLVSALYDYKIAEATLDNAMGKPIR